MLNVRVNVINGTPIDACMRSMMWRRGIEIFRTVPRIVPPKFPQTQNPAGRIVPAADP
jgi:hypothetical protein